MEIRFNVELADLIAPRPVLTAAATGDWTRNPPRQEFPAIKRIYGLYDKELLVESVQFNAPHNYNQANREAVYDFFARKVLGLDHGPKESDIPVQSTLLPGREPIRKSRSKGVSMVSWVTRAILALFLGECLLQPCWSQGTGEIRVATSQPAFCGPQDERLQVIKEPETAQPPRLSAGRARIHIFWRGSRFRVWKGAQCKVALNGTWVAALAKNTYSVIDVPAGKLRFCSASSFGFGQQMKPTWRSLLFLYASPDEDYFVECSPGADDIGATEPSLFELEQNAGRKVVAKLRLVTFRIKEGVQ